MRVGASNPSAAAVACRSIAKPVPASAALPSVSSLTEPSAPRRRLLSRDRSRTKRAKAAETHQKPGTTTITALATNGQALRCAVTVNSDVGKVTLNKRDLLLRTVGSKEALTASVAVENGVNVPITWVSSNPGVATVDASGVVTAVADGEAKITALSPDGRFDSCSVFVGLAADKYDTEEDLAEELKLPDPYVAVRMNRLS